MNKKNASRESSSVHQAPVEGRLVTCETGARRKKGFSLMCMKCGKPAFYLRSCPIPGSLMRSQDAWVERGPRPRKGDPIACQFCSYPVAIEALRMSLVTPR